MGAISPFSILVLNPGFMGAIYIYMLLISIVISIKNNNNTVNSFMGAISRSSVPVLNLSELSGVSIPVIDLSELSGASIPVIDLSELSGPQQDQVVGCIIDACQRYGVFQVINHGMPVEFLNELKETVYRFFDQPEENKVTYIKEGKEDTPVMYGRGTAEEPIDILFMSGDEEYARVHWPDICKEEAIKYQNFAGTLAEQIMRILLNDLGVTLTEPIIDMYTAEKDVLMNHYSVFPNANLEISAKRKHTDPYTLTIILQDHVGGLFAKLNDEQWVEVQPIPEALVIIVGNTLEVISNGKYKAGAHYVQTAGKETRISLPLFVHPRPTTKIHPHPQAVERDGGKAQYREVIYKEQYDNVYNDYDSHNESSTDRYKISY